MYKRYLIQDSSFYQIPQKAKIYDMKFEMIDEADVLARGDILHSDIFVFFKRTSV